MRKLDEGPACACEHRRCLHWRLMDPLPSAERKRHGEPEDAWYGACRVIGCGCKKFN